MADDDPPRSSDPPDVPDADVDADRNASDHVPGTAGPGGPVPDDDAGRTGPTAIDGDAARVIRTDAGRAVEADTQAGQGHGATSPDVTPPIPPRAPTWAGRAEVPVRGRGAPGGPPPVDWSYGDGSYGDEPDGRRWWMPILVGVIALVLLTVLVVAGWVIIDSARREAPDPPTPAVTTPAATPARTSAAPTTTPPSPTATPSATASTTVVVPPLVGLPEQEAVELLEQFGLVPRLRFRASDRPAGTVLQTDPSAGREVAPGDQVTLVIAEPRPDPPTTSVPTPSVSPQEDD
ncbi:PASTA domain-containing protein [Plantactinospora solaniradicis]|uniref:PASTA domain-containing protein n=1 Tax=Plantactinospora solaniradicis TaxID=1723736 RepID=A0ABW1KEK0_9ACTN